MDMPRNTFKHALRAGQVQIGMWSSLCDGLSVEILAQAGFDWLLLDTELAPNELPMVVRQLQAISAGSCQAIVRPPWNDAVMIKRFLDAGAQSLLVPMIQNADEARRAVAATRYPPRGIRGFSAAARASGFGRVDNYYGQCEDELCVLVQIETRAALAKIEEIAAVDGVDGIFIGPGDLSADFGYLGQPNHPDMIKTIDGAMARIRAAGKPAGFLTGNEDLAQHYIDAGCLFVAVGADIGLLTKGANHLVQKFKKHN
jgi:4-hydroxy-2-oxoheptanedioate aldolase